MTNFDEVRPGAIFVAHDYSVPESTRLRLMTICGAPIAANKPGKYRVNAIPTDFLAIDSLGRPSLPSSDGCEWVIAASRPQLMNRVRLDLLQGSPIGHLDRDNYEKLCADVYDSLTSHVLDRVTIRGRVGEIILGKGDFISFDNGRPAIVMSNGPVSRLLGQTLILVARKDSELVAAAKFPRGNPRLKAIDNERINESRGAVLSYHQVLKHASRANRPLAYQAA